MPMDPKTAWWQRLSAAQKPKQSPPDDPRSQEDEETRKLIAHYLHLADLLLSTENAQEAEKDESSAA